MVEISYYIDGLEKVLKGVTKEAHIYDWIYNKQNLERVIKASANARRLIIRSSKIPDEEFDLSGPEYNTTYLSFASWGAEGRNGWNSNPDWFEKLIKAISLCSMKGKLATLDVYNCWLTTQKVNELLSKYGMPNVYLKLILQKDGICFKFINIKLNKLELNISYCLFIY